MARLTKAQINKKKSEGKRLYTKGFELEQIADILDLTIDTVKKYADKGDWEHSRQLNNMSPDELRHMILECMADIKEGKQPRYSPDQISKLAASFEKLSDSRKRLYNESSALMNFMDWCMIKDLEKAKEISILSDLYIEELKQKN
jgi:predicted transcriptional regulator